MSYVTVNGLFETKEEAFQDVIVNQISHLQVTNERFPVPVLSRMSGHLKPGVGVQYWSEDQLAKHPEYVLCSRSVGNLYQGNYYYLIDQEDFCVMDSTGQVHFFPEDAIEDYFTLSIKQLNLRAAIVYILFEYDIPKAVFTNIQNLVNFASTQLKLNNYELIELREDQLSGHYKWKRFFTDNPVSWKL